MKGVMLLFCVAAVLACDLPRSHADQALLREQGAPRQEILRSEILAPQASVVGRAAVGDRFLLLTSGRRVIEIDGDGTAWLRDLPGTDAELWNLAAASDGSLWALAGRDTLVEIAPGRPPRHLALDGAYAGVHSGPGFLLYQPYDFRVGSAALLRGEPAAVGAPAGRLDVAGGSGPRAAVWMRSLVQCGFVSGGRVPCWAVGRAVVDVIDAAGTGRLVLLAQLTPRVEPSAEEFAESGRPVLQDVALDGDSLLVLAAAPGAPVLKERGVRDLWRYSLSGARLERHRLTLPMRMLIVPGRDRLLALSGDGHLVRLELR